MAQIDTRLDSGLRQNDDLSSVSYPIKYVKHTNSLGFDLNSPATEPVVI